MRDKKLHYSGKFLSLHTWKQTLSDGSEREFERVERKPTVSIIAMEGDKVYIISEHRYEVGGAVDKFPAGFVDDGEQIEHAAQRELQEELGFKASTLTLIGKTSKRATFDFPEYVFLAQGLIPSKLPHDEGEEILEIKLLPLEEVARKILHHELYYSFTSFVFLTHFWESL